MILKKTKKQNGSKWDERPSISMVVQKKSSSLDHTYCVEQKLKSFQLHVLDMADTLKVKAW